MCDWVTLLYSRNWYNVVNQLGFTFKKERKKRNWQPQEVPSSVSAGNADPRQRGHLSGQPQREHLCKGWEPGANTQPPPPPAQNAHWHPGDTLHLRFHPTLGLNHFLQKAVWLENTEGCSCATNLHVLTPQSNSQRKMTRMTVRIIPKDL